MSYSESSLNFQIQARDSRIYILESSDDMSNWSTLDQQGPFAFDRSIQFQASPTELKRFYRARIE